MLVVCLRKKALLFEKKQKLFLVFAAALALVSANLIVMSTSLQQPRTQEQFFAWEGHRDGRYEFDGFAPVAMTGGTDNHCSDGRRRSPYE